MPRRTHRRLAHHCSQCGRRFDTFDARSRHQREVHPVRPVDTDEIPEFDPTPKRAITDAENRGDYRARPNKGSRGIRHDEIGVRFDGRSRPQD